MSTVSAARGRSSISLVCPDCGGPLSLAAETCVCSQCRRSFLTLLGIPDLRVSTDTWLDYDADRSLANSLAQHYPTESFADLVGRVWRSRAAVPQDILERRLREIFQAQEKYVAELSPGGWIGQLLEQPGFQNCLEVGCGTGGFLEAAARRLPAACGVDVSLSWLITARKRLEERGVSCLLLCACVEKLPFEAGQFDLIASFDVLEHVSDRDQMIAELHRTARTSGLVVCSTPNRFSFSPEPHVRLWGVGYLPRRFMSAYVHWRRGMPYLHTYPLSFLDLKRLFRKRFQCEIKISSVWEGDIEAFFRMKSIFARLYNRAIRLPLIRPVLIPIAPFFQIIARKV